jgi:hypothetical protein
MAKYTFVVMTNPVAGKEAEFNDWYNRNHIPDVLNVPGFVCAQRFRLAEVQMGGDAAGRPYKYLAIYEIETDDLEGALRELRSRAQSGEIVPSDAIDMNNVSTYMFTPIAEKVMASDVRRSRAA